MHLSTSIALALAVLAGQAGSAGQPGQAGQNVADVRQLYDAGRYQEVVRAADLTQGRSR